MDITIHNDCDKTIDEELSLFILFQGLNHLKEKISEEIYYEGIMKLFNGGLLTPNARNNFFLKEKKTLGVSSYKVLIKAIKIHNPGYFSLIFKTTRNMEKQEESQRLDLNDQFCFQQFENNIHIYSMENGMKKMIDDLRRLIIFIRCHNIFYLKTKTFSGEFHLTSLNKQDAKSYLSIYKSKGTYGLRPPGLGSTYGSWKDVWEVVINNIELFLYDGVVFYSESPNFYSLFNGYKYKLLEEVDEEILKDWFILARDIICDRDEESYEYLMNWLAKIFQSPVQKNDTAVIIYGPSGGGKTMFINFISKLFGQFGLDNLTKLEDLIGNFNGLIENKKFVCCNELSSIEGKNINFDNLKSILTEKTITINEKGKKKREAINVSNFIFVSNHQYVIKMSIDDRRYFVTKICEDYVGNYKFFEGLVDRMNNKKFMNNLFTFFMKRDISNYNERKIPLNQKRKDMINLSMSTEELFIKNNMESLRNGWEFGDLYDSYVSFCMEERIKNEFIKSKNFLSRSLKNYCYKKRTGKDRKTRTVYWISDSFYNKFSLINDVDDVED